MFHLQPLFQIKKIKQSSISLNLEDCNLNAAPSGISNSGISVNRLLAIKRGTWFKYLCLVSRINNLSMLSWLIYLLGVTIEIPGFHIDSISYAVRHPRCFVACWLVDKLMMMNHLIFHVLRTVWWVIQVPVTRLLLSAHLTLLFNSHGSGHCCWRDWSSL